MPATRRFGRHIHHDPRSRRYPYRSAPTAIKAVRHLRHAPIWDQGQTGSCTGQAALGCLTTGPFYPTVAAQTRFPLTEHGAIAVYSAATRLDNINGEYPPDDTGSSGLAAAKALKAAGLISGYQHTFTLADALTALQAVPLICGTVWRANMGDPSPEGLVSVEGRELGGHEYVIDEYDPVRGWVGCTNSWGVTFGLAGRFYIQAEDLGDLLRDGGDVTVFVPRTAPPPQPNDGSMTDAAFAATLRPWASRRHWGRNARVAKAAQDWLTARSDLDRIEQLLEHR